ncbi:MAG: hypothetical protein QOG04_841 [Actinomycetota bacterium]|nr:hypothetical protein [Actinomycetota bacterium]
MKNLWGLVVFVASLAAIAFLNLGVALFIYALLLVIMVHELGHLSAAKFFGFKATQYFLGFGPTIWSRQKGETEYGVKAIPAGGFVKIVGMSPYEEIEPEDEPRSYPNKPRWQRAILLVAGSATHWVVAFIILLIIAFGIGFPGDPTNRVAEVVASVDGVPTAAAREGLQPDDQIVKLDGQPVDRWNEIVDYIETHANRVGHFTILRDGQTLDLDIPIVEALLGPRGPVQVALPGEHVDAPGRQQQVEGFLGISPDRPNQRTGFVEGFSYAGGAIVSFTARSVTSLPDIFTPVFNGELWRSLGEHGAREATGPIGVVDMARISSQAIDRGLYAEVLEMIAMITVFIGFMNLLPLPPLDGGHLAVLLWEKVTGKKVDVRKLMPLAATVIAFFTVLFVAVLYLGLARPIENPF